MPQKSLFNIFSKKPELVQPPQPKVIIDYREKNSLVPSALKKLGIQIEFKQLKVADYIAKGVAIERKTISDFLGSMVNKRLTKQLQELQQYKKHLLIIEGFEDQELYNGHGINENAIRGFLLSISLKHNTPIIFSQNHEDTAKFIERIAKKKPQPEQSINATKKALNKKEQMQFILESFPGIGPKTAKKLLKEFKTIQNLINTPIEKIQECIGKKAEIFKILQEKY